MDQSSSAPTEDFGDTLVNLSKFVHDLSYDDIPTKVIRMEKQHVLDTLGCILYGTTTPWVRKAVRACERLGESGSVSVLGMEQSVLPRSAALLNGTASHSMDFDDHCQEAGIHAGSATLPPAFAYIEHSNTRVTGRELLTALVAGVEVGIRSGYGVGYGSVSRGWHIAGWTGAFASAATVAKLQGLDESQIAHALAIAGTQGCGLLGAQYGAEVKRFHMGKAAEAGYLAVALAQEGFSGDTRIFEDRYGAIGRTMSDDYDIPAVTEGLGETYILLDKLTFKPFPSVGQVHAPVDAVREVLETQNIDPDAVTSVTVRTTPTVKDHVGWEYVPADIMSAQANIQYAIGALLIDGDVTIDDYTAEAIRRSDVLDRISDIAVLVDESLASESFGSIVDVHSADNTWTNVVETPRGYPTNPLTDDELLAKFQTQAEKSLPDTAVNQLAERIDEMEDIADVHSIIELC